jgi:hypothetical protein
MRPDFIPVRRRLGSDKPELGKEEVLEITDKKILKTCLVCKRTFLGWFSEKYCSSDCRMEGNRLKARLRKRKSRKVGDLKEGIISQQLGELGLAETQYPMYNHEIVPTMYANFALYHARDGKRHVRSYYDLLRDIAKLNGTNLRTMLANMAPRDEQN